ncbi:hypothetical protein HK100_005252 [Physocladia obscura]|uniref:ABC transporter domain-containing protein n=1 Tax=Physocladia obscura TaxID=109957 RepID=A0AAD5SS00_9FUNG|nr:hypothetical protein HK100_005252 [Physocladia obscura]
MEPDILLLDEPTNHLDLPAILWLQKYLKNLDTVTLVIVSHDRSFLNETVTEIIEMRNRALSYHSGNYDEFVADQEDKQIRDIHRVEALEKKKAHIEKSIQEGLRHAKKTGDDKKLGMVKSRQRKLDERFGLDVNENGHRFKLNRDMAGYHTTRRPGVELDIKDAPPKWSIPEPELPKNKSPLVEMESVSFSYSSNSRNVLQNVTLNIQMSEHIGIVGANGQGKSTLVNLLLKKLVPNKGTVQHHPKAKIAYISQDLTVSLPLEKTPLGLMKEQFPDVSEQELRAHLGGFGVGGIATRPLSGFSGGQRVRVVVALECFGGKNILLLDEPTNHLDLDTIEAMLQALKETRLYILFKIVDLNCSKGELEIMPKLRTRDVGAGEVTGGGGLGARLADSGCGGGGMEAPKHTGDAELTHFELNQFCKTTTMNKLRAIGASLSGTSEISTCLNRQQISEIDLTRDPLLKHALSHETIFFVFKSTRHSYIFTDLACIAVKGDDATSTRRWVERFEYYEQSITDVRFETGGAGITTGGRDVVLSFHSSRGREEIEIWKNEIEIAHYFYKALVKLAQVQGKNRQLFSLSAGLAAKLVVGNGTDFSKAVTDYAEDILERYSPRSYGKVFTELGY